MTYEAKKILMIEDATDAHGFNARAIVFENDTDTDALTVTDLLECDNIDTLRDAVKERHPSITHYKGHSSFDGTGLLRGGWSDALRIAKDNAYEAAAEEGADVRKNMSLRHLSEAKHAAIAAREARELEALERAEAEAAAEAERKVRAEERKDFDAWSQMARAARDDDKNDFQLGVMMRWAYNEVDRFPEELAKHVEDLQQNPTNTLAWSGNFVQASANNDVARYLVEVFESGVSFEGMQELVMREMFSKADRSMSRSTSVMSNVVEDCTRVAWHEAAKRVTGRSFW